MNANELADLLEVDSWYKLVTREEITTMLRQQQAEIEDLKNANRFIQNFAQEQHQRAVALEMRELTDEEIAELSDKILCYQIYDNKESGVFEFARAILKKASEK